MRGIDTPVRKMRREIFKEIAQLAYHSDNLNDDVEALPYKIVNPETPIYRESIYREREIVREQIRLAMGLSLRPEDAPVHVTQGLEESNIDEKYYEPPMIQVIPSACNACPENEYCVTPAPSPQCPLHSPVLSLLLCSRSHPPLCPHWQVWLRNLLSAFRRPPGLSLHDPVPLRSYSVCPA